jgi:hypothetical protein
MNLTMMSSLAKVSRRRFGVVAAGTLLAASTLGAQATSSPIVGDETWRLGASVGVFAPRSPVVVAPSGGEDTRLNASSAFSIDLQYLWSPLFATYANGLTSFTSLSRGSTMRATTGPSDQVMILGGTIGAILSPKWLGETIRPTLRAGVGYKGYMFDLTDAESQWRTTGDFGVGFRAANSGKLEVSAEMRYLPSSFDQGKIPLRSVTPQAQRQSDFIFGIAVSVRP